jgi:hydrogenase/urease accessory protein HupE
MRPASGTVTVTQVERVITLVVALSFLLPAQGLTHQFAPALLELQEVGPNRTKVRWKQPAIRVQGSQLRPVLPADCRGMGKPSVQRTGTDMEAHWHLTCPNGLVGKTVGVEGIGTSGADVLLRVKLVRGRVIQHVLTADAPAFTVAAPASPLSVIASYARLGIEHIITGVDHLLFVFGLTLLVGRSHRLLWTITAFTLGHSVTLGLAVLGLINLPPASIEAGIALSIYLLAVELARPQQPTWLQTYPWLMAGLFGLLHGLGFAGALAEIGLPEGDIPLALFAFNLGIELGQLAFIAGVVVLWTFLARWHVPWPQMVRLVPAYVMGSLAAFWCFDRLWQALGQVHVDTSVAQLLY